MHFTLMILICSGLSPVDESKPAATVVDTTAPSDATSASDSTDAQPLPQAHAHNDYYHTRPLLDAVECGFCSFEADIFLVNEQLLVGHFPFELKPECSLQSLYLDPLRKLVTANGGRVYKGGPEVTLLIDIKNKGEQTWARLREVLAEYDDILSEVNNGKVTRRAVRVIISGDRPQQAIAATTRRFAGIDGRLSDLGSDKPPHLMPLISDRWSSHFEWFGEGEFPAEQRVKLQRYVKQTHAAGRRIRFWATPDRPSVWSELQKAGVDHINADDLNGLKNYLKSQPQ